MSKKAGVTKKNGQRAPGLKIKKGDRVLVIAGRDNGREGVVVAAFPDKQKLLVQGVNMIKKNTKVDYQGRQRRQAGWHRPPGGAHPREQRAADRRGDQEAHPGRLPVRGRPEGPGLPGQR